jgi:hypothetical protein
MVRRVAIWILITASGLSGLVIVYKAMTDDRAEGTPVTQVAQGTIDVLVDCTATSPPSVPANKATPQRVTVTNNTLSDLRIESVIYFPGDRVDAGSRPVELPPYISITYGVPGLGGEGARIITSLGAFEVRCDPAVGTASGAFPGPAITISDPTQGSVDIHVQCSALAQNVRVTNNTDGFITVHSVMHLPLRVPRRGHEMMLRPGDEIVIDSGGNGARVDTSLGTFEVLCDPAVGAASGSIALPR